MADRELKKLRAKLKTGPAEKIRWRIANLLDKLPGQCWSDLVSWVLDTPRFRREKGRLPWRPMGYSCRADFERTGCCYCGKLRSADLVPLDVMDTDDPSGDDPWSSAEARADDPARPGGTT